MIELNAITTLPSNCTLGSRPELNGFPGECMTIFICEHT